MTNSVKVLFFASLAETVGHSELQLQAVDTAQLFTSLQNELTAEAMAALLEDNVRIAVNHSLVDGVTALAEGDEVAFLPPITGG